MLVYVATKFDRWFDAALAHERLVLAGHEPTSRWVETAREVDGVCERVPVDDPRRAREAQMDLSDVMRSDAVIGLVPEAGGTGMWWEIGAASALAVNGDMRVILVGPALKRTIFAELPDVAVVDTVEEAIALLGHKALIRDREVKSLDIHVNEEWLKAMEAKEVE
jgi:hypothetical protein